MEIHKQISADKIFIFKFSFSPDEPLSPPSSLSQSGEPVIPNPGASYVECQFYRDDHPDKFYHWAGNLTEVNPISFALPPDSDGTPDKTYPDDNNCKGKFKLYENFYMGKRFVWFDIRFGPGYLCNFQGAVVSIEGDKT